MKKLKAPFIWCQCICVIAGDLDDLAIENTRSVTSDALGAIGMPLLTDRLPVDSTHVNLGKIQAALSHCWQLRETIGGDALSVTDVDFPFALSLDDKNVVARLKILWQTRS